MTRPGLAAVAIRACPAALVMAAIFYFSHQTGDDLNSLLPWFQRWVPSMMSFDWGHFVSYFGLALAFLWAFGESRPSWRTQAAVVLLCGLYGLTDEYHQRFVPGRSPDLADLRNDMIGAALAMLFVRLPGISALFSFLVRRLIPGARR